MDALFFLRHSNANDLEIRFALRSIHRHAPWIRKVWIFGDRPEFLTEDTSRIQHIPHEYLSRIGPFRTPVTNAFLLFYLSSQIPELSFDYLWFTDDSILIQDLSEEMARLDLYLEDMTQVKVRGKGIYKEFLWRTYDLLQKLGLPRYNFDTHTPQYYNKKRVVEAYCEFRDYITEDRFWGPAGSMAIPNHALSKGDFRLTHLGDRRAGFYERASDYEQVVAVTQGKLYLNFDDEGFGPGVRQFLQERFPEPSPFEKSPDVTQAAVKNHIPDKAPATIAVPPTQSILVLPSQAYVTQLPIQSPSKKEKEKPKKNVGLLAKKRRT